MIPENLRRNSPHRIDVTRPPTRAGPRTLTEKRRRGYEMVPRSASSTPDMTHASARHRQFDRAASAAAGEPAGHALLRSRDRMKDMRSMQQPSIVLAELWERTSQAGRTYYTGFMGRRRVALVAAGEREHKGATVKVWNLVLADQVQSGHGENG